MKPLSLAVLALAVIAGGFAQSGEDPKPFDGLNLNLGNLYRLSKAQSRSISPGELHRRKRQRRHGYRRHRQDAGRELGQGWKVSPSVTIKPKARPSPWPTSRTRRHPADLDDAHRQLALFHPPLLLGRRDRAFGRSARSAISSPAAGASTPRSPRCRSASTPAAPSTATGRCPSARRCRITLENIDDEGHDALLPDQLHADRGARGRRLFPRPVPPRQPAALQGGLHHPRRRRGPGAVRRHLHGLGRATTTAGGARARSSSSWTATRSSRRSAARAPRTISAARTTSRTGRHSSTRSSPRPTPACRRSSARTGSTTSQQRFGLYRWHIMDPVRFEKDLKVTIQALGWRGGGRYLPLQDDIASVAFWYQRSRTPPFPKLPSEERAGDHLIASRRYQRSVRKGEAGKTLPIRQVGKGCLVPAEPDRLGRHGPSDYLDDDRFAGRLPPPPYRRYDHLPPTSNHLKGWLSLAIKPPPL